MSLRNITLLLIFAIGFSFSSFAATFTINFNPDAPANTNGWDFGTSTASTTTTQSPGGRKLEYSKTKEAPPVISSPVYKAKIKNVSISFKGNNVETGNEAQLVLESRESKNNEYTPIFTLTGIPGSSTNLTDSAISTALKSINYHQLRITFIKDQRGTLILSTVTITDDRTTGDGTVGEITENATGDGGSGEEGGGSGGDGSGDGDATGDDAKITAPTGVRAGKLPDGKIRLGWTTPDAATNVTLRVWTLTKTGGLAAITDNDILWRESFTNAPAESLNNNTAISKKNLSKYMDNDETVWDVERFIKVFPYTVAGTIKIGTGDFAGALVTKPLNISGDGLALVVTAKRTDENPNVILHAAVLSPDATTTNEIGQTALTDDFAEYAFPIENTFDATDALLIESLGPSNGRRIIIDDIALVKNYTPVTVTTNEVIRVNLGDEIDEYELAASNVVRYAAFCAQDATGTTSEWTTPLTLDPATLEEWKDHHLTLDSHGKAEATLDIETLPDETDDKYDVANEPFRFLIDGLEQTFINKRRDVRTKLTKGIYVCTNVFEKNWITLIPASVDTVSGSSEAEMRVAIESGEFSVRKISLSGTFAQLNVSNNVERSILFQRRWITKNGDAKDWQTFDSFKTRYTSADAAPDLSSTMTNITATAQFRAPTGARVEVRIVNRRRQDEKEAPIGFRDLVLQAESAPRAIIIVIR